MSKIPKEIVEMIEERNRLDEKIKNWCEENLDMSGMNSKFAEIVDYHNGEEQGTDDCKEWCNQYVGFFEDDFYGDYYWETENENKFLHMEFSV